MDSTTHYIEFLHACHIVITDKDCTKYFKRYDPELPRVTKTIGMLKSINPYSLLDVGSGRGRALWPIVYNMPSCKIICIEPVKWRCQVINAVHTGGVNRIKAIQGNIIEAPLHHNSFDVVLALEVIEHIPEATLAIAEMMRISRKYIIISVPSKPDKNPDHVHFFPPDLLKSTLIEAAGIANKELRRIKLNYVRNSMITLIRLEYGE